MAFSFKEFGRIGVLVATVGSGIFAFNEGFNRSANTPINLPNPLVRPTPAPIYRLLEPSAARAVTPQANPPETPEQQAERMTMLSRSLFEHLGIGESDNLKKDADGLTFDERMVQRGSRVHPKTFTSRQFLPAESTLKTFDFPATDAQELPTFAINENSKFPVDAQVQVSHENGTSDFFAARWHSIEKRWLFTHVNTQ